MPYAYEGFGIALLEAMGFGLPVIGSTRGAAQEMIRSGVNGYLVGPGNGFALGPMIEELFFDRRRLLRMSLAARQHFEQHPTWSQSMTRAEGFLVELVKRWHR
jgi:glycosyltransferase involved in cell wall biosynthesis